MSSASDLQILGLPTASGREKAQCECSPPTNRGVQLTEGPFLSKKGRGEVDTIGYVKPLPPEVGSQRCETGGEGESA